MDEVQDLGVNLNALVSESLPVFSTVSICQLLPIRKDLFTEAVARGLTCDGDYSFHGVEILVRIF